MSSGDKHHRPDNLDINDPRSPKRACRNSNREKDVEITAPSAGASNGSDEKAIAAPSLSALEEHVREFAREYEALLRRVAYLPFETEELLAEVFKCTKDRARLLGNHGKFKAWNAIFRSRFSEFDDFRSLKCTQWACTLGDECPVIPTVRLLGRVGWNDEASGVEEMLQVAGHDDLDNDSPVPLGHLGHASEDSIPLYALDLISGFDLGFEHTYGRLTLDTEYSETKALANFTGAVASLRDDESLEWKAATIKNLTSILLQPSLQLGAFFAWPRNPLPQKRTPRPRRSAIGVLRGITALRAFLGDKEQDSEPLKELDSAIFRRSGDLLDALGSIYELGTRHLLPQLTGLVLEFLGASFRVELGVLLSDASEARLAWSSDVDTTWHANFVKGTSSAFAGPKCHDPCKAFDVDDPPVVELPPEHSPSTDAGNEKRAAMACACKDTEHATPMNAEERAADDDEAASKREWEAHTEEYRAAWTAMADGDDIQGMNSTDGELAKQKWQATFHPIYCCARRHRRLDVGMEWCE